MNLPTTSLPHNDGTITFLPNYVEKLREHLRNFAGLSMGGKSSNKLQKEIFRRKIIKKFLIQKKLHENNFLLVIKNFVQEMTQKKTSGGKAYV